MHLELTHSGINGAAWLKDDIAPQLHNARFRGDEVRLGGAVAGGVGEVLLDQRRVARQPQVSVFVL